MAGRCSAWLCWARHSEDVEYSNLVPSLEALMDIKSYHLCTMRAVKLGKMLLASNIHDENALGFLHSDKCEISFEPGDDFMVIVTVVPLSSAREEKEAHGKNQV